MNRKLLLALCLVCAFFRVGAQDENLKLHYDFSSETDGKITDLTGNGYDATLRNYAYLDDMGEYKVLNLGLENGYLDLGEKVGELINTMVNFTVSAYVCVHEQGDMHANGNFIWSFSNSDDIMKDANGCMFFSGKAQGYGISRTDYRAEVGFSLGSPLPKSTWKHVVYTQTRTAGRIYMDGELVKSGTVSLTPKILGKTKFNYVGRSPYLHDAYLKALIADFKIYNEALTLPEIASLATELPALQEAYPGYTQKPMRHIATCNPLFSHKYTADPAAMVHNDVFYLYAGQDTGDGGGYNIPNWLVFSTEDMESWYEHPVPLKATDFSWASRDAWASQVIQRNGKFYWYVCAEHINGGKALGVAVSDSPTGPFVDARGTALVTNDMTTATGIWWDDIDPTVWIDDDGQAYLIWGNTACYYAKLKENMIELDGGIKTFDLPFFTEAPWIHKRGDWYYLSYAAWFPEKICYAMSKSIEGPWEYKGVLNEIAGNSNTNHQAIVEFKDKWYFVYHNGSLPTAGGSYLRSTCIDYLHYNEDGTIKRIQMTSEGVDKVPASVTSISVAPVVNSKISVYPNPTDGILNIDYPESGEATQEFTLAVYDLSGQSRVARKVSSFPAQLNLSGLGKGNYILKCTNKKGVNDQAKVIIK